MNANQETKINMYRATQKHCADNAAIVATVPAFQTAFTAYNVKISAIIAAAQQEDLATKGITIDKADSKKSLCRLATDIASLIFAFASANTNKTLQQEVNFSYSDLLKTKDDILGPRCQNIKDLGTVNLIALAPYGLTAASLTALQTEINVYQQKVPTPRNSAAQKKTIRENLKNLIKETDSILKNQMDKTVIGFKATDPFFVSTYKSNRIIIDAGKSVTTLRGSIINEMTNSPIYSAAILIVETSNKTNTDASGAFEIKSIPAGLYTVTITASSYKTKTITDVVVKLGQNNLLNSSLQLDIA